MCLSSGEESIGSENSFSGKYSLFFVLNHRQSHTWGLVFGINYALFVNVI